MIRLLPELDEDLLIKLFHKGAKVTWTSEDLDWGSSLQMDEAQKRSLARLLSPVYLGEQTAMVGASTVLPEVMKKQETTAQLYLSSFIMDEARHFEALTRLYHHMDYHPVSLREMPAMLRYHHRLRQGDRVDWVWGILISDLFAKHFYQIFACNQPQALFGQMSHRILKDESRHQAFAVDYLSKAMPVISDERRQALIDMRDDLLILMDDMYDTLHADTDRLGINGSIFLEQLKEDIELKSQAIGLVDSDQEDRDPPGSSANADEKAADMPVGSKAGTDPGTDGLIHQARRMMQPRRRLWRPFVSNDDESESTGDGDGCGGCFLAAICRSPLVASLAT